LLILTVYRLQNLGVLPLVEKWNFWGKMPIFIENEAKTNGWWLTTGQP